MVMLLSGLALFLGIHMTAVAGVRDKGVAALGLNAWRGVYGLVAVIGLALIWLGYADARAAPTVLYTPPSFAPHLVLLLMVPVFPLVLAAYLPGRIQTMMKHPMLVATKLWALSHLIANGMLADVLLFGGILAWAVLVRISLKRRPSRGLMISAPASKFNDLIAAALGLVLYLAFVMMLHELLIGVPPVAMGG